MVPELLRFLHPEFANRKSQVFRSNQPNDGLPGGRIVVRAMGQDGNITDFVRGLADGQGSKLTIDEMKEIAMQGWAKAK